MANEQQEREVLDKLEREGYVWNGEGEKPTEFVPSHIEHLVEFPYALLDDGELGWNYMSQLEDEEIVFDGRKESKMGDKYVVSQEFMNELEEWKEDYITDADEKYHYASAGDLEILPGMIKDWWIGLNKPIEKNNRLIAIIRWVNGEDVFEVEKPKKWVVRSIGLTDDDERYYVSIGKFMGLKRAISTYSISQATRFDTKEEAESWANAHQEVIEVEG